MSKNKEDLAKSIAAKLSKISKTSQVPYQNLATSFLIERLLARLLATSKLAKALVFKGGYVGLRVYNTDRYTVDLDALLIRSDVPTILKIAREAVESDIEDGVWFQLELQIDLKTQGEYGGVRQVYRAGIGEKPSDIKRSQSINFDVGIGDPVTPGPIIAKIDELIGDGELSWQVYPIETIVAEKLQTLVARGDDNSRAKDVFDLFYFLPKANEKILYKALEDCFDFRESEMPPDLSEYLAQMDLSLLKRGWKSATTSLKNPPEFNEAFDVILETLKQMNLGAGKRSKK